MSLFQSYSIFLSFPFPYPLPSFLASFLLSPHYLFLLFFLLSVLLSLSFTFPLLSFPSAFPSLRSTKLMFEDDVHSTSTTLLYYFFFCSFPSNFPLLFSLYFFSSFSFSCCFCFLVSCFVPLRPFLRLPRRLFCLLVHFRIFPFLFLLVLVIRIIFFLLHSPPLTHPLPEPLTPALC